jgi:hypothetical protein
MHSRSTAGRSLRRWLRQRRFVQRALDTPPDPLFSRPPSARVVTGLLVLGASYLLGWPAVAALGAMAVWWERPKLLLGGPIIYGFSWLVFAVGLALIGSNSVRAGRALCVALVRKLAQRYLIE